MWILLGGTFYTGGFVVSGPFKTLAEAETAMDPMMKLYDLGDCPEFWCFELTKQVDHYAPGGNAIVFDGDITRSVWRFFGPFRDIKAARRWADEAGGCAIELKPVSVKEPA